MKAQEIINQCDWEKEPINWEELKKKVQEDFQELKLEKFP